VPDFKFNGKELDEENGMYYFEARYQRPPVFISRDPLFEKYPTLSPYSYCANNPVKYIDTDGRKIIAVNEITRQYMKQYFNDQFGSDKIFRFTSSGELKINKKQYNKALSNATDNQRILLEGMEQAIDAEQKVMVNIDKDVTTFLFYNTPYIIGYDNYNIPIYSEELYNKIVLEPDAGGVTKEYSPIIDAYSIAFRHDGAENQSYSTGLITKPKTGKSASSLFMHEVLDEFLNYYVYGKNKDSKLEHVFYQNNALENKGLPKRNGEDHQE
jgi:RHS repeat-associated protein